VLVARVPAAAVLAARVLAAALPLTGCVDPITVAVRKADRLFGEKGWEEAAIAYASLPGDDPGWSGYGSYRAAVIYRDSLADGKRAEKQFDTCAKEYGETEWGYTCVVELADLRFDEQQPRLAIDAYRRALELRPAGPWSEHCLLRSGRAYALLGEHEQARVEWRELTQRYPNSTLAADVAFETARSFDLEGRLKEARAAYKRLRARFPEHSIAPIAAFSEAEVLEQLGEFDAARALYESIRSEHPNPTAVGQRIERLTARQARRDAVPPALTGTQEKDPAAGL
jgi:TolA-binding protein